MQYFKFENWRIGEFDFWCHEQVILFTSENYFLILPPKKLSNVNKTYIDIINGQEFELLGNNVEY